MDLDPAPRIISEQSPDPEPGRDPDNVFNLDKDPDLYLDPAPSFKFKKPDPALNFIKIRVKYRIRIRIRKNIAHNILILYFLC